MRGGEASESLRIIRRLREAGFVAYLAGGCVRDALLGKRPKDYDVATDATPDAIREVFGPTRTQAFGASFGVIGVLPPRGSRRDVGRGNREPTEVATFRSDGYYSDGRRPDSVHFGDARHDALRRDFTINGLFYDPLRNEVIDYVGGQADLAAGILRTIGEPLARFGEDKLRMLRAVRFATTLGFTIEEATGRAILEHADDIAGVSGERVGAEMRRVLVSEYGVTGLRHLLACGLERVVLPEIETADMARLEALMQYPQGHDFPLALALLMMVLREPERSLQAIAARWRLSKEDVRRAGAAFEHWPTIARGSELPWSVVQPVLVDRDAGTIVQLAAAVVATDALPAAGVELAQQALAWPAERLDPPPLLSGDDLRQLGMPPGPAYRLILQSIRSAQLDGQITSRQQALGMVRF